MNAQRMNAQRGSAQQGVALIMWMFIVLLVLFAIAAFLGYSQLAENTDLKAEVAEAIAEKEKAEADVAEKISEITDLNKLIGFGGSDIAAANLSAAGDRLATLRGKFSNLTDADTTLESALAGIEKAYDDQVVAATQARSDAEQWKSDKDAAEQARSQVVAAKDAEISSLSDDLAAEKSRAQRQQGQSQATIDQQRERISTLENQVADITETSKREKNQLANELAAMDAKVQEINERNRVLRERMGPDGSVVTADDDLGLVFLDFGAKHGLKRGTPFKVWAYGKGKTKIEKGEIEVREVHPDYAVAGIVSVADSLNPISKGDQVSNIYFDRGKTPEFVFLGEIPGRFSNEEAERILRSRGADVAKTVTANTDFLVVGRSGPEGGDAPLEQSEAFRLAELYGVEILPGSELEQYIRY